MTKRFVLLLATGVLMGAAYHPISKQLERRPFIQAFHGQAVASNETGRELTLIYIGSSACTWSNLNGLPEKVRKLRATIREDAARRGYRFASIGIAKDRDVARGINHLQKFAPFDEITTGRGWLNSGITSYLYDFAGGAVATPQILLVEREIDREAPVPVENVRLLGRAVGVAGIEQWLHREQLVPPLSGGATAIQAGELR